MKGKRKHQLQIWPARSLVKETAEGRLFRRTLAGKRPQPLMRGPDQWFCTRCMLWHKQEWWSIHDLVEMIAMTAHGAGADS